MKNIYTAEAMTGLSAEQLRIALKNTSQPPKNIHKMMFEALEHIRLSERTESGY